MIFLYYSNGLSCQIFGSKMNILPAPLFTDESEGKQKMIYKKDLNFGGPQAKRVGYGFSKVTI